MSLRRTALTRKRELRRRTPMPRDQFARADRAAKSVDTKRRPRNTGPSTTQRRTVAERAGHCCELCGLALHNGDQWTQDHSIHHRQPRGMGGTSREVVNTPPYLLLLCGTGTTGCHGRVESRRAEAYAKGWLVRSGRDPLTVPVQVWWSPEPLLLADDGTYRKSAA